MSHRRRYEDYIRFYTRRRTISGAGSPPPITAATSYRVTPSSTTVLVGDPVVITAQLLDQSGNPFPEAGHTVTWSKSTPDGSFESGTSVTDASGAATVTLTTPGTVETFTVTATDENSLTGTSPEIATHNLALVATDYLVTPASTTPVVGAADLITAQLRDQFGNPLAEAGHTVTWTKSSPDGSFDSPTSTTDASGVATVTLTAPATVTALTVTATDENAVTGTSPTITTVRVPTSYAVTVPDYTPTEATDETVTAQLLDQDGVALAEAGHTVTWSKSVAGGSFSAPTSVTDASGTATVTLTVPAASDGAFTVTATDENSLTGTSSAITPEVAGSVDPLIQALIDGLLDDGEADLYAGTPPRSTLDTAAGSTLLGTFGFSNPAAPEENLVSSTSIDLNTIDATAYVADAGTDKWLRIRKPDGTVLADVVVATSGAPVTIASDTVALAQVLTLALNAAVA